MLVHGYNELDNICCTVHTLTNGIEHMVKKPRISRETTYKAGYPSSNRLVFWIQLDSRSYLVVGSNGTRLSYA